MNETKKVVDSKEAFIEMLEEGEAYFVNSGTWTVKGVDEFIDQYQLPKMLDILVRSLYLNVIAELIKLPEVTEETVHDYCCAGLRLMCIDFDRYFPD